MKKILLSLFICLVFLFSAWSPDGGQTTDPDNPNPDVPVAPVPSEENVVKLWILWLATLVKTAVWNSR